MLGLPSGFSDRFYELEASTPLVEPALYDSWVAQFVHRCALEAGDVIDRNVSKAKTLPASRKPSQRMVELEASAPAGWWDLPTSLPSPGAELDRLVDILLVQLFFFHVQMYTHLPCLTAETGAAIDGNASKQDCSSAARELLKRYLLLRSRVKGAYVFDCRTSDFVGFTAALVLLLCTHTQPLPSWSEDRQLIGDTEKLFLRLQRETGCIVATQCLKTLQLLNPWSTMQHSPFDLPQEIQIPYFGRLVRRRPVDNSPILPDTPQKPQDVDRNRDATNCISYCLSDPGFANFLGNTETFDAHSDSNLFLWENGGMLDIDQDWSMFPAMHSISSDFDLNLN